MIEIYVKLIKRGVMNLEEVPQTVRQDVESALNV